MTDPRLSGLRVMVVEDEALIAMALEDMLEQLGCQIVEMVGRVSAAREAVDDLTLDCAILDVNVAGEMIYPLAEQLTERGVPFLLVTGYARSNLEPSLRSRPVLQKPFHLTMLNDALVDLIGAKRKSPEKKVH
jgi:DNA-binding NtrC family response regulator